MKIAFKLNSKYLYKHNENTRCILYYYFKEIINIHILHIIINSHPPLLPLKKYKDDRQWNK